MMKKIIISLILASFIFLVSCRNQNDIYKPKEQVFFDESLETTNNDSEIVKQSSHYRLTRLNSLYYCDFYNDNGDVVKSEGPFANIPEITVVDDDLYEFTYSAGIDKGTQWRFYYDSDKDVFSKVFYSIYDYNNGLIAYTEQNKVVIRDIFDKTKFYKEIFNFEYAFSNTVDPFVNVEFLDGNSIKVIYLSGANYEEKAEIFEY